MFTIGIITLLVIIYAFTLASASSYGFKTFGK